MSTRVKTQTKTDAAAPAAPRATVPQTGAAHAGIQLRNAELSAVDRAGNRTVGMIPSAAQLNTGVCSASLRNGGAR